MTPTKGVFCQVQSEKKNHLALKFEGGKWCKCFVEAEGVAQKQNINKCTVN